MQVSYHPCLPSAIFLSNWSCRISPHCWCFLSVIFHPLIPPCSLALYFCFSLLYSELTQSLSPTTNPIVIVSLKKSFTSGRIIFLFNSRHCLHSCFQHTPCSLLSLSVSESQVLLSSIPLEYIFSFLEGMERKSHLTQGRGGIYYQMNPLYSPTLVSVSQGTWWLQFPRAFQGSEDSLHLLLISIILCGFQLSLCHLGHLPVRFLPS